MTETYNFQMPRNLYEKLERDSEKLDVVVDCDHIFNFIATAYHLQDWIRKSPLKDSTPVKRLLKRLNEDPNLRICENIARANSHFEVDRSSEECNLKVDGECINVIHFKNDILQLYELFFKVK